MTLFYAVKELSGGRLRIRHKIHTFNDVSEYLKAAGAGEDILTGVKSLFTTCEQGRYAGERIKGNEELP